MNFIAPLNSLGFGIYSFGYLRAFQSLGIEVNLHPIGSDKNKLWAGASEASELAKIFGITEYDIESHQSTCALAFNPYKIKSINIYFFIVRSNNF